MKSVFWLEDVLVIVTPKANPTRLRSEEEKAVFLQELEIEGRFEGEGDGPFLKRCEEGCEGKAVDGWVWKLPRVRFDTEALVIRESSGDSEKEDEESDDGGNAYLFE